MAGSAADLKDFVGKWEFKESDDNFEAFMQTIGVGLMTRKIGVRSKPDAFFTIDGEKIKMKQVGLKTIEVEFELGKEVAEHTPDGRDVQSTFTFADGKLTQVQKQKKYDDATFVREIVEEDGKQIMNVTCTAGSVVCKRKYQKAA